MVCFDIILSVVILDVVILSRIVRWR